MPGEGVSRRHTEERTVRRARTSTKAPLVLCLAILLGACATAGDHWMQTQERDTIESYEGFLRRHGDSEWTEEASARLEVLLAERGWGVARERDEVESYEEFLGRHGDSEHAEEARARIEVLLTERDRRIAERDWRIVRGRDEVELYEEFLRHHGASEYAQEARTRIETLGSEMEWTATREADRISVYEGFLLRNPRSRRVQDANDRLALLNRYLDGWLGVEEAATVSAYREYLARNPGSPFASRAREAVAGMQARHLADLLMDGKVEARVVGSGIQAISVSLRRLVSYPVTAELPVGIYFVSEDPSVQNMVSTRGTSRILDTDEWVEFSVPVACANLAREVPYGQDSFSVQRSPHERTLANLMPVLESAGVGSGVRQAAVWIATDNADYAGLGILERPSPFRGMLGSRRIEEHQAALAMQLCAEAGIAVTHRAIWEDRRRILDGLADGAVKRWLQQYAEAVVGAARELLDPERFVLIQPGSFRMGSTAGDVDEQPVHNVSINRPFYLQKTEVTQRQWNSLMDANPSRFHSCGDTCPVESVGWEEIQEFLRRLNAADPGANYRLPTEAEWEYAARAGTAGEYGGVGMLDQMGWYDENSAGRTHPAAQKQANAWGLFDMHGNVWEWVQDWYGEDYYAVSPTNNPSGPASGQVRVMRGGSWFDRASFARSAFRWVGSSSPQRGTAGFRVAMTARGGGR